MHDVSTPDLSRIAQDLQIRKVQVESVVQLLDKDDTLVAVNTVKVSPALSVKPNWNAPPGRIVALSNFIGVADQTLRPGKIAMDDGEFKPEAKTETSPRSTPDVRTTLATPSVMSTV